MARPEAYLQSGERASIAQQFAHVLADRERRGEAGGFDAEEVHQARNAVILRALNQEIARGLVPRLDLGPDARIRGLQGAVREARPVAAYRAVERPGAARVDVVADALDPFDVGAETRLACEVESEVHAAPRRFRGGVDEAAERRAARQAEVVALAVVGGGQPVRRKAFDDARQLLREQACAVDYPPREQPSGFDTADLELDTVRLDAAAKHGAAERERRAAVLGVSAQGEHEAVAVDDPGGGRFQRSDAGELRLQRASFGVREHFQIGHAVLGGLRAELFQRGNLRHFGRDDELAATPVRNAVLREKRVKSLAARDAQLRLERAARIVDSRVDDFAVARAGAGADRAFRFEDDHLATSKREGSCARQADHACAYDDRIDPFHGAASLLGGGASVNLLYWGRSRRTGYEIPGQILTPIRPRHLDGR